MKNNKELAQIYSSVEDIETMDVSAGTLEPVKINKSRIISMIYGIKDEMEREWDKSNPESRLLRNFIRGRITTCDDIILQIMTIKDEVKL